MSLPVRRLHHFSGRGKHVLPLTLVSLVAGAIAACQGASPETGAADASVRAVVAIPRTWDERALATQELPNALTGAPTVPVSADFYYAVPVRTVYRTYPIYVPGLEPEGYTNMLLETEPEIVMGPGDSAGAYVDWTEEDWVRAGEEVFRTPLRSFPLPPGMLAKYVDESAQLGAPTTADGSLPFMRYVISERGILEVGGLSCAQCHTRVMPDGSRVIGAQGNEPFDRSFALALEGLSADEAPARITGLFGMLAKEGVAPTIPKGVDGQMLAAAHGAIPPGVIARHGTSSFSPVQIPDLIGVQDRRYLDRTGLHRHRDIGDLMRYVALNQGMDRLTSWDGYVPETEELRAAHRAGFMNDEELAAQLARVDDPASHIRYSDPQLYALAKYLYALDPPPNPNVMDELALEGSVLFEMEECGRCHPAPHYTSHQLVPAPGFKVPEALRASEDVRRDPIGTDPRLTLTTRRGTGFYKVPSLKGVWYRGPFSHDGSVAELEDWFDPRRLQDEYVPTGWNPGGGARAVKGHKFGLDLSAEDRTALIAFLRTL